MSTIARCDTDDAEAGVGQVDAWREAAAYYRVSGKSQVDGDGPERQDDKITRFARSERFELLLGTFDAGVSGAKAFEDRPGLASLLEWLAEHPSCKVIIVERADRLARDLIVQELTIRECQKLGIEIIEAEGGYSLTNSNDPTRKLIRQILGAVSEWDKDSTVLKLRAARARIKQRTGKCEGRKSFGAKPGEEIILQRILELSGTHSSRSVAKMLNDEQLKTREGGQWSFATVAKIIRTNKGKTDARQLVA